MVADTVAAGAAPQAARKWWLGELARTANEREVTLQELPVTASDIAELQGLVDAGTINDKLARQALEGVLAGEGSPAAVVEARGLVVVSDDSALEAAVDELLSAGVLVDLYAVVRGAIRVSAPSYSIKKLEPLYMGDDLREGEVTDAAASIVEYHAYCQARDSGDAEGAAQLLAEIRDYNRYDCESTRRLRDWLLERAAEHGVTYATKADLFQQSDFISIHMVLSDRSRGLVRKTDLEMMKPTAFIINTSRGPIIDEAALVTALRNRTIAGAGLDVFEVHGDDRVRVREAGLLDAAAGRGHAGQQVRPHRPVADENLLLEQPEKSRAHARARLFTRRAGDASEEGEPVQPRAGEQYASTAFRPPFLAR